MGQIQFGRNWRLTFGQLGASGVSATENRVRFKIEQASEYYPNKATIGIYNLTTATRTKAEKKDNIVALDVGYGGRLENLFIGDVGRAISSVEGVDAITEFECGEGENAYRNANADITFGPGAKAADVIKRLSDMFGLGKGEQSGIPNYTFQNGLTLSGPIRQHLSYLAASLGLEWSIQGGALQIIKRGSTTQDEAVLLTPETGLIGSPKKKDHGLEVKCLLQPRIKPGRAVVIKSKFVRGVFRVLKATHDGDTHDTPWYTTFEVPSL